MGLGGFGSLIYFITIFFFLLLAEGMERVGSVDLERTSIKFATEREFVS